MTCLRGTAAVGKQQAGTWGSGWALVGFASFDWAELLMNHLSSCSVYRLFDSHIPHCHIPTLWDTPRDGDDPPAAVQRSTALLEKKFLAVQDFCFL